MTHMGRDESCPDAVMAAVEGPATAFTEVVGSAMRLNDEDLPSVRCIKK